MDLNQLQHYAAMAVNFDREKNVEAAKYFYRQAAALISEAVENKQILPQVLWLLLVVRVSFLLFLSVVEPIRA